MRKRISFFCRAASVWGTLLLPACVHGQVRAGLPATIIPEPVRIRGDTGNCICDRNFHLEGRLGSAAARLLTIQLQKIPDTFPTALQRQPYTILLTGQGSDTLPPEGYTLDVSPGRIRLCGSDTGLYYAAQTLLQLVRNGSGTVSSVSVYDYPRFRYRGLMMDVSRHFFTVHQIKQMLDLMASYKLNVFHWHLTDDNGWRLPIPAFPKLTSIGAWRVARQGEFGTADPPMAGETPAYGGYYSPSAIREILAFARDRYIEVIPEIDIPGHSMAAIASYPWLCCTRDTAIRVNPGSPFARWFSDGSFRMYADNALNPSSEDVYRFVDSVLSEVAAIFPSKYIHIGGDECYKGYWEKDKGVQQLMKRLHVTDIDAVQAYFTRRVCAMVEKLGKVPIGWDEVLSGNTDSTVVLMCRRDATVGRAAHLGHPVILTPGAHGFYFDYSQSRSKQEPSSHGGFAPLKRTYDYDPAGDSLQEPENILGIEGCVWTEHIANMSKWEYMVLPRMLALAEVAWTPAARKNYSDFMHVRLPSQLLWFDRLGFHYRVPTAVSPTDTTLISKTFNIRMQAPFDGARVYYTLNGKSPLRQGKRYTGPLKIILHAGDHKMLQTLVITPGGNHSLITHTELTTLQKHP